ncbi:MAG TPA: hypothetical protein VIW23_10120 [Candidatus Acidoferrum sp.]
MTKANQILFCGIISLAVIAVLFTLLTIRSGRSAAAQVEPHDFGSEMVKKAKQGHFDEAIQIGLHAIQNQPGDEFVYQQIADVYLIRAGKDPDQKEQWVSKAIFYTEKSLSLNSRDRDLAGLRLLEDARSFEVAGDLVSASRCAYYVRAAKILEDRVVLLQGDHLTLEGKDFPLAPLREKNEKRLGEVKAKSAKAGCK